MLLVRTYLNILVVVHGIHQYGCADVHIAVSDQLTAFWHRGAESAMMVSTLIYVDTYDRESYRVIEAPGRWAQT